MKTIDRLVLVLKSRRKLSGGAVDTAERISPQADAFAEAVDQQLAAQAKAHAEDTKRQIESFGAHLERELEQLERRLTQPRKVDTSAARFDPE